MTALAASASLVRTCMRDRIRDVLISRILDGQYPAGAQLKELALAREFNVSQAPIREALRELEGCGLVTCERYRGTRVRGADPREMRESYELRATLELRALELAMPFERLAIRKLQACLDEMAAAAERGDDERYIDEALSFHRGLIEASGNRVFATVWDSLHFAVRGRIALRGMAALHGGLAPFVQLHSKLIEAIADSDLPTARTLLRSLFASVAEAFELAR